MKIDIQEMIEWTDNEISKAYLGEDFKYRSNMLIAIRHHLASAQDARRAALEEAREACIEVAVKWDDSDKYCGPEDAAEECADRIGALISSTVSRMPGDDAVEEESIKALRYISEHRWVAERDRSHCWKWINDFCDVADATISKITERR